MLEKSRSQSLIYASSSGASLLLLVLFIFIKQPK